ncbi:hypothetical protein C8R45DRAFT_1111750 [Mycena sanguinolenta]|nr:hypothetical protein C8R45DRAFT_1111750 [Mycena sanguinolenta]
MAPFTSWCGALTRWVRAHARACDASAIFHAILELPFHLSRAHVLPASANPNLMISLTSSLPLQLLLAPTRRLISVPSPPLGLYHHPALPPTLGSRNRQCSFLLLPASTRGQHPHLDTRFPILPPLGCQDIDIASGLVLITVPQPPRSSTAAFPFAIGCSMRDGCGAR